MGWFGILGGVITAGRSSIGYNMTWWTDGENAMIFGMYMRNGMGWDGISGFQWSSFVGKGLGVDVMGGSWAGSEKIDSGWKRGGSEKQKGGDSGLLPPYYHIGCGII